MLMRTLFRSSDIDDIELALKAIGNAGFVEFLQPMTTFINDKTKSSTLRMQAVHSLHSTIFKNPMEVSIFSIYFKSKTKIIWYVRL